MKSIINSFLILIVYCSFWSHLKAQSYNDSLKIQDEEIINSILDVNECRDIRGAFFLVKISKNDEGLISSFIFRNITENLELVAGPYEPGFTYHASFLRIENKQIEAGIASRKCDEKHLNFGCYDGKLFYMDHYNERYRLFYNENGIAVKVNNESYSKINGMWQKDYYKLERNNNGELNKISLVTSIGKGKILSEVVEQYTFPKTEKIFLKKTAVYDSIRFVEYKLKYKKSDPEIITSDHIVTIRIDGNIETYKMYNENLKMIKHTVKEYTNGLVTYAIAYLEDDMRSNEYYYDTQGKLEKVVEKIVNKEDNLFKFHRELLYTYTLKEGALSDDLCSYAYEVLDRHFDNKGECYEEIKGSLIRKKLENGTWGPWIQMHF